MTAITVFVVSYRKRKAFGDFKKRLELINNYFDAVGLTVFTVIGVKKAADTDFGGHFVFAVCMGMLTGVGGGILRHIFVDRTPSVLQKHIYAVASIVGAVVYFFGKKYFEKTVAVVISVAIIIVLRLLATRFCWQLPKIDLDKSKYGRDESMTIQQCKYILKIAECGSLNEAAKQLYVAQSSLSVSVKSLEQELNIEIFRRAGGGVHLTEAGVEFVQYARRLVEQSDLILDRFTENRHLNHLNISTQHYDFVADVFGRLLNETKESHYRFSLREMKTYDVIRETELAFCDIGILAIKDKDRSIMERFIAGKGLTFAPLLKALPHVFLRKEHPAAKADVITLEALKDYPYVSYEQGEHSSSFFTEEIAWVCSDKQVEISDRASLMNVLLASDCYTFGTGIMPSLLNCGRIVSIPLESDDFYIIGTVMRADRKVSDLAEKFLEMLKVNAGDYDCK